MPQLSVFYATISWKRLSASTQICLSSKDLKLWNSSWLGILRSAMNFCQAILHLHIRSLLIRLDARRYMSPSLGRQALILSGWTLVFWCESVKSHCETMSEPVLKPNVRLICFNLSQRYALRNIIPHITYVHVYTYIYIYVYICTLLCTMCSTLW